MGGRSPAQRVCWRASFALLLGLVFLGGCGPPGSVSRQRSEAQFAFRDETLRWQLPVHERAERLAFTVDVNLTSGAARWTLRDPEGVVRVEGTGEAPRRTSEDHRFSVMEGDWVLTMVLEEAGGRYAWDWSSSWVDR